jgi:hypothetical protein
MGIHPGNVIYREIWPAETGLMLMRMSPAPWFFRLAAMTTGHGLHARGDAPSRGLARDPARRREGDVDG